MAETSGVVETLNTVAEKERDYWRNREAAQTALIQASAGEDEDRALQWIEQYGLDFSRLVDQKTGDSTIVEAIRDGRQEEALELLKKKLYGEASRPAA